jgi:CHAD domain-containing protein
MSFRLRVDETIEEGIKRIIGEQITKAVAEVDDPRLDAHETVHQVRKRCKKIRGFLRLVRSALEEGTYAEENAWFRDASRPLSHVRDARALVESYDALMERFGDQVERRTFAPVRRALTLRCRDIAAKEADLDARLVEFKEAMHAARERMSSWHCRACGFQALASNLKKTYRRGRQAMAKAYVKERREDFHEWRKRVKYHWYHMRLLRDVWRPVMQERSDQVKELSDGLGDEHDLTVFHQILADELDTFGDPERVTLLINLINVRSAEFRFQARYLGKQVYAEKPGQLVRRLERYWDAWHARCDETLVPAGEAVPVVG